ncbi:MAG: FAD/NAD(P)-binding protein [Panacagrimonas sp.]
MFEWLVVGGGIHGVHIAARLIAEARVDPDQIRIVDPEPLLARWKANTAATGMRHLRSPIVHHLDLTASSLRWFAAQLKAGQADLFAPPYDRPVLALFNQHSDYVIRKYGLDRCHVAESVAHISPVSGGLKVQSETAKVRKTRRVVLATGLSDQPWRPAWARSHPAIHHLFDREPGQSMHCADQVAVVGGGISAAQVSLRLIEQGVFVHLVMRHRLRVHQFDSDPGWLGPKYMRAFARSSDYEQRRAMIAQARHRGSVSDVIGSAIERAVEQGRLHLHQSEVETVTPCAGVLKVKLACGASFQAERILLATGFCDHRPGGKLVDRLVEQFELPTAGCGYPIVDRYLRWHPRIFTAGPLAELELGPVARNIAGARRGADRLVGFALNKAGRG